MSEPLEYEEAITEKYHIKARSGNEFLCVCIYHDDDPSGRPNLYINGVSGLYFCHVCKASGKLDDPEPSGKFLLQRLRKIDKGEVGEHRNTTTQAKTLPESYLKQFEYEHDYWEKARRLSPETIELFGLGYDLINNELTIPYRDHRGNLKGVIRRLLDPTLPYRYKDPKGVKTSRYLFAAWLVPGHAKVALVEGPIDAIACWNARVPAVAVLGSNVSEAQSVILQRLGISTVVTMFDRDEAGSHGLERLRERLPKEILIREGKYRNYWAGDDPADLRPAQIRKMYHSADVSVF